MLRRKFLEGIIFSLASFSCCSIAVANTPETINKLKMISVSKRLMGTDVDIITYNESSLYASEAIENMINLAHSLVSVFSRHDGNSAISFLNDNKYIKNPPPELEYVLKKSIYFNKITMGAFDIRVFPIIKMIENNYALRDIKNKFNDIKWQDKNPIIFEKEKIIFSDNLESITLDGIAKGYIVDLMLDNAKKKGLKHCIINAGGDIRAFGGIPGNKNWEISIYNPLTKKIEVDKIYLQNGAVATSGIYFKKYDIDGYNHIIDYKSQKSPLHHPSATIIASTATTADAMATACVVLDTKNASEIIAKQNLKGIFIKDNKEIFKTG